MNPKPSSDHGKRVITALVVGFLLLICVFWGGPVIFALVVWAVFSLGNRELQHLFYEKPAGFDLLFFWLIGTLAICGAYFRGMEGLFLALILGSLFSFFHWIPSFPKQNRFYEYMGKQLLSLWYLPLFFSFFILIRADAQGVSWIFFLLAVNSAGDIGAFYVGRNLGRHKLAPMVSPQKTIEGSIAGLAANILVTWILKEIIFIRYPLLPMLSLGLTIGIVSQVGDLLESMFKRTARVKDSGSILPGHGGFLDRVDSLLLPAPVVYFFIQFFQTG